MGPTGAEEGAFDPKPLLCTRQRSPGFPRAAQFISPCPALVDMGASTAHPHPDGSVSSILRRSRRGGDEVQSSAALLDGGAGGLSWGCGWGWLRCCRSPGTRWT